MGYNLARYFRQRGHSVTVLDSLVRAGSETNIPSLRRMGIPFLRGDVRLKGDVFQLRNCEVILDCAAQPSAIAGDADPEADFQHNILGTFHVLELARQCGLGVVFWSTNKVYSGDKVNKVESERKGDRWQWWTEPHRTYGLNEDFPLDGGDKSVYGVSKVAGDLLCQEYASAFNLPVWINRCSCLAGKYQWGKPEQGWVAWFVIAGLFNLPVELFGWQGCQLRDVLFVDDLALLVEKQLQQMSSAKGQVFNVGGGPSVGFQSSPLELVKLVEELIGSPMTYTVSEAVRRADHRIYVSDIRKVKERFGWSPTISVRQGVEDILRWARENEGTLRALYAGGS